MEQTIQMFQQRVKELEAQLKENTKSEPAQDVSTREAVKSVLDKWKQKKLTAPQALRALEDYLKDTGVP
mgnify:FL=1